MEAGREMRDGTDGIQERGMSLVESGSEGERERKSLGE